MKYSDLGEDIHFLGAFHFSYSGGITVAELEVDVRGQTCPVPLVECRKAFKKASPGDLVIVKGTHPASKKKFPWHVRLWGGSPCWRLKTKKKEKNGK